MDPVPAMAVLAFGLGVLAGLVALAGFLGVFLSGIAGEYSYPAIVSWAAASGVMIAFFTLALWIGGRETRRRGIDGRFIRRHVGAAVGALLAAAATVGLVAANIGRAFLPVLGDALVVVFLANLIGCNLAIWRRLKAQADQAEDG